MATLRTEARTEPDAVRDIIETERTDLEINAFINAASYTVDRIEDAEDPADGLLAEIETWLTAHLLTTRNEIAETERHESYRVDYLRETSYGETAMNLDPSNVLGPDEAYIEFGVPDAKGTRDD